jgi:hypothetical protein
VLTEVNDDVSMREGSLIDDIVREGARRMLAAALEAEAEAHFAELADPRDERGRDALAFPGDLSVTRFCAVFVPVTARRKCGWCWTRAPASAASS